MILTDFFNNNKKTIAEGGPYDLPGIDYNRPGDTPRKPKSHSGTIPRRHPDDADFMDPDQRRLRADQERVRKANAEYFAKQKQQGVAEGYPKHQDLSGISTERLKAYVKKVSGGGVPQFGAGAQLKRVQQELKRREQGVAEGDVVQFPKKHRGDLEDTHDCPKCGGDLQGGTYMGHKVKVCMPCKQVYLPPNSGIDQQGNKIDEYGDTAKGQKMLTKVQKRAVDRAIKADDKRDKVAAKKNSDTAHRAWDRMTDKDVAEGQEVDASVVVGKLYDIIDHAEDSIKNADFDRQVQYATVVRDRAVKALNMIKTNPASAKAAWKYLQNGEQGVSEAEQQKGADYRDPKEADYGDDYQDMVKRVGQKAKQQQQQKSKPVSEAQQARRNLLKQIVSKK